MRADPREALRESLGGERKGQQVEYEDRYEVQHKCCRRWFNWLDIRDFVQVAEVPVPGRTLGYCDDHGDAYVVAVREARYTRRGQ